MTIDIIIDISLSKQSKKYFDITHIKIGITQTC